MKQNISKEQWDEITSKQQDDIIGSGCETGDTLMVHGYFPLTIGQLIEFIGDDLIEIQHYKELDKTYIVHIGNFYREKELCDALWRAVKFKLNTWEDKINPNDECHKYKGKTMSVGTAE